MHARMHKDMETRRGILQLFLRRGLHENNVQAIKVDNNILVLMVVI